MILVYNEYEINDAIVMLSTTPVMGRIVFKAANFRGKGINRLIEDFVLLNMYVWNTLFSRHPNYQQKCTH
jgi:hypothetical protein